MKTPLWLATEHARAFVRNRGWRVESLTWEEVELILDNAHTLERQRIGSLFDEAWRHGVAAAGEEEEAS